MKMFYIHLLLCRAGILSCHSCSIKKLITISKFTSRRKGFLRYKLTQTTRRRDFPLGYACTVLQMLFNCRAGIHSCHSCFIKKLITISKFTSRRKGFLRYKLTQTTRRRDFPSGYTCTALQMLFNCRAGILSCHFGFYFKNNIHFKINHTQEGIPALQNLFSF